MAMNEIAGIQQSSVVRSLLLAPFALLLTLLLFSMLASLTNTGEIRLPKVQDVSLFDFILARNESDLELIKRQRPPLPEEISQPDKPSLDQPSMAESLSADMPNSQFDAPSINIDMKIDLSPALSNLNSATLQTQMFAVDIAIDTRPTVIKRTSPRYPTRALRKKLEGSVLVEFIVSRAGNVLAESLKVIESIPKGTFDRAVLRSLKRWRFKVKLVDGLAVEYKARQRLEFKLDK
jgi:protein TonB